jgi:hypothetical protein
LKIIRYVVTDKNLNKLDYNLNFRFCDMNVLIIGFTIILMCFWVSFIAFKAVKIIQSLILFVVTGIKLNIIITFWEWSEGIIKSKFFNALKYNSEKCNFYTKPVFDKN